MSALSTARHSQRGTISYLQKLVKVTEISVGYFDIIFEPNSDTIWAATTQNNKLC
jgi:hypothetical protein